MPSNELILLSRQALLFANADTIHILHSSSVLIINANVTGCEIARNLGLAGVHKIYFANEYNFASNPQCDEFKSRFFNPSIHEKIVKLADFDSNGGEGFLNLINQIESLKVVIVCEALLDEEKYTQWNLITRAQSISYIQTLTCGLISYLFVDAGENYNYTTISDSRIKKVIRSIRSSTDNGTGDSNRQVIIQVADQKHQLSPGSYVKFSDLEGSNSQFFLNNSPFEVTEFISANEFSIKIHPEAELNLSDVNIVSGCVEEVERPFLINHRSLKENQIDPVWESPLMGKRMHNFMFIYKYFKSISEFAHSVNSGKLPGIRNEKDYLEFYSHFGEEFKTFDTDQLKTAIFQTQGTAPAMTNVIGGMVSHEVLKILHRSFLPISQWLFFESLSSLPKDYLNLPEENFVASPEEKNRDNIRLFGRDIQEKLSKRNLLLVGAGALGCEFLKLFSEMGISSNNSPVGSENGEGGTIFLCDSDHINASNLHRQFLFHKSDVGNSKAKTACNRMKEIDNDINITPFVSQLSLNSLLNTFTDKNIWNNIREVVCAVDNINAREIIDKLCFSYKKLMLESGTHGNVCNTTTFIPSITTRYKAIPDPENETNCLGKEFPFRPRHTVSWAKDLFKFYFQRAVNIYNNVGPSTHANNYFTSGNEGDNNDLGQFLVSLRTLESLICSLEDNDEQSQKSKVSEFIAEIATTQYNSLFKRIILMQQRNPIDSLDEFGDKFWSGYKIYPRLLDEEDESTQIFKNLFIKSVSSLIEQIISPLYKRGEKSSLLPLKFNKDNELHIRYLYSTANLYSKCFGIPVISKIQAQIYGGEITPAIITVSCICVGLVALEIYKILDFSTPLNTPNIIHLDDIEMKKNDDLQRDHVEMDSVLNRLKNYSYNANANHFHQFTPNVLGNDSINDNNTARIRDNIIILKTNDHSIKFSTIVQNVRNQLGIRILRIYNYQFQKSGKGYDIVFSQYSDVEEEEKPVLSLLSSLGKFSTSSFFFEAEFEDVDGENAIDLFLQFSRLP